MKKRIILLGSSSLLASNFNSIYSNFEIYNFLDLILKIIKIFLN